MDTFDGTTVVTGYASIAFIIVIAGMLKPIINRDAFLPLVTLLIAVLWNTLFTWLDGQDIRTGIKVGLLSGVYASGAYSYVKASGVGNSLMKLNPFGKKENNSDEDL